jgi:IS5 family transposase
VKQISFSEAEFAAKRRVTRRERFLADMERVIPWQDVLSIIEPYYPKGKRGRPPIGLARMLRGYLVQQWYGLSDEGVEDAITDSQALRGFVGIDLSREAVPDATTLLQFRHLLEEKELSVRIVCGKCQYAAHRASLTPGKFAAGIFETRRRFLADS